MKTLLVEDDRTSQMLMTKVLQPFGPVHIAENGRRAVECMHAALHNGTRFDLILMDIMMPGMDGQTALRRIRELEDDLKIAPAARVKVIMTTALADEKNVLAALQQQCASYLLKPIGKPRLLAELRRLELIPEEDAVANDGDDDAHPDR